MSKLPTTTPITPTTPTTPTLGTTEPTDALEHVIYEICGSKHDQIYAILEEAGTESVVDMMMFSK